MNEDNKLFIGNLDWNITKEELKDIFAAIGKVFEAIIVTDRETGKSRGFGFVTMGSNEECERALQTLDKTEIRGRMIHISKALPKTQNRE